MPIPEIVNLAVLRHLKKTTTAPHVKNSTKRCQFSLVVLLAFLLAIAVAGDPAWAQESAGGGGFNPQEMLRNALQWIENLGAVGAIAFICLYVVATVAFLPGSILTLGAGVVFGVVLGSLYVFIGATAG
ncbi:MAG: TVP38/TMEM64 family protein, partial [Cyanobacteriota bacterium]|nr:TVP38/TMEM64 family protein [Cyanobacteriota bacterium]